MDTTIETTERKVTTEMLPKSPARSKQSSAAQQDAPTVSTVETEQLIFTLQPDTGDIVKIEIVDKGGNCSEISEDKMRQLAGEDEISEIDSALDAAFDSAFVEALEKSAEIESEEETEGDPVLERLIMWRLLGRRIGSKLYGLHRTLLRRLVLRRLVRRHVLRSRLQEATTP